MLTWRRKIGAWLPFVFGVASVPGHYQFIASGLAFGVVVTVVMVVTEIVQVLAGLAPVPSASAIAVELVANLAFLSWPVAWLLHDA